MAIQNHIFIISFCVFIFINLIENLIHYNIGRHSDSNIILDSPTKKDWIRIILVMIIFGILQVFFTYYFKKKLE
jgi:hypothetical protein